MFCSVISLLFVGVLKLRVPEKESGKLPALFDEFERRGKELQIEDFLLSLTSMEEVNIVLMSVRAHTQRQLTNHMSRCF
jgi:hypothetical protein